MQRSVRKGSVWQRNDDGQLFVVLMSPPVYFDDEGNCTNRFIGFGGLEGSGGGLIYEDEFREKYSWVRGR